MAKTSTKKKTSSKKKTSKKKSKQLSFSDIILRKEVTSTVTFLAGLFLLIVALFPGGAESFWNAIHSFYFAIFGICGYYIPLAVLFFGVMCILNKQKNAHFAKAGELLFLFALISSFLFVNTQTALSDTVLL